MKTKPSPLTASIATHLRPSLRRRALTGALATGALLLAPETQSPAALAGGKTTTTATCNYVGSPATKQWCFRVDPPGMVQGFQLHVNFDPAVCYYVTQEFKNPFTSVTVLPDGPGRLIIQSPIIPGPLQPGDVDIFELLFYQISPTPPPPGGGLPFPPPLQDVSFTTFADPTVSSVSGSADFISVLDCNQTLRIAAADIAPTTRFVTPGVANLMWDPNLGYNDTIKGGAGTWDTTATSFDRVLSTNVAAVNVAWNNTSNANDVLVLGGNPGTGIVTIQAAGINAGGMQFDTPGYTITGPGTLTLTAPPGFKPNFDTGANTATLDVVIAGTPGTGIQKVGAGTLVLTQANLYDGPTCVLGGLVQISSDANLGTVPGTPMPGAIVLDGGGLRATARMELNADRGISLGVAGGSLASTSSLTYSGVIAGPGALRINGGVINLGGGTNTYSGGTIIDSGSLVICNAETLGTGAVTVNGNVTTGSSSGQLLICGTYPTQNFALPPISIAGGGPNGNGLALLSVGNNNLSGGIATASTVTTRLGSSFGMMSINGLALGTGQSTIVTSNLVANNTLTGLTGTTNATLQKQGTSTLILTGSNSNQGIVDLNGGFVRVSSAANLGTSTAANSINHNNASLEVRTDAPDFGAKGMSIATNNGTVNLDRLPGGIGMNQTVAFANLTVAANRNITFNSRNGYGATFAALLGGAAGQNTVTNNGNGPVTFSGNVWNNSDGTARVLTMAAANANSAIVINGNIIANNTAAHSLAKTGTGTLTILGTASTYSGQTDIQNGTVTVRNFGSLGNSSVAPNILLGNAANTGTLNFIGAAGSGAIPTPSIARNIILNGTTGGGRINANQTGSAPTALVLAGTITNTGAGIKTLTLGGSSALDNELAGSLADQAAGTIANLTKVDGGTWVLSGANTYTGTTTISGGTLKLTDNNISSIIADTSGLTFNADPVTQSAGGNLIFGGPADVAHVETMGVLTPTQGAGTVSLISGGSASMVFSSLGGTASSIASSINIVGANVANTVTITAQPTGFVRSNVYYNGGDFAYSAAGILRAPVYGDGLGGGGSDIGFLTTAAALVANLHNEVTGSFTQGTTTINSLKIAGGQTLTLTGLLGIQNGSSTAGGIVMSGAAAATITGGSISQGSGAAVNGGAGLAVRVDDAAGSLTLVSPITNSTIGGLTKSGAGTLILASNAHAYGGGTNILEGTLRLAGATTVMGGANGVTTIRQGATLDVNGVNTGTRIGLLQGAGTITNTGSAAALVQIGNGNGAGTWTGIISNGSGGLAVTKAGTGSPAWSGASTYTGTTSILSTGIISVPNLSNIGTPSGIGAGNALSNATNSASLLFGGASTAGATGGISYNGNDSISIDRLFTFAGSAAASGGRIQGNGANNAVLVFNNSNAIAYTAGANGVAQTLTLGGASTGDNTMNVQLVNPTGVASAVLNLLKADAGTWVLSNNSNSYTGTTAIGGGRLVATDGLTLPTASPLVLAGGVFQSNGSFTRALNAAPAPGGGGVHWAGNQGAVGGGFAANDSKFTVNIGPNTALTWGNGGFATAVGTAAASSTLILNSTTALAEVEFQNAIDLGPVSRTIQVDENTTTTTDFATLSGVLSGSTTGTAGSGIAKTGAGALQLLGANTYAGATLLSAGSLYVQSFGGTGSAASNLGAGSAVLRLGGGTLVYAGMGESSDRAVALNASTVLDASGAGPLFLTGAYSSPGSVARTLTLQGPNTDGNEISSVLSNPVAGTLALSVTKAGGGTWILSGNNTHTGTTSLNSGALGVGHNNALGTGTLAFTNASLFANGADRTIGNNVTMNNATGAIIGFNSLTATGTATFGAGGNFTLNNNVAAGKSFTITGPLTNADAGTARNFAVGGTGQTVISGVFGQTAGSPAASLTLNSGTLVLGGASANTYSGNTTINGGIFQLAGGSGNVIPDGAGNGNVTIANTTIPALFDLNGQTETINGFTGISTGAKTLDNTSTNAATLTLGNNNGPVNFNGSIANCGPLSIIKTGTAAGILSGTVLTYNGTTTVQTGGSLSFPIGTPIATTGLTVAGGAGFSILNGMGVPLSALTLMDLGGGAGTATLGLDLGPISDTLTTSGAAVTANTIAFDLNGLPGFGAGTYNLLVSSAGGLLPGGVSYTLSSVPGGYSYTINQSATLISLTATALGAQTLHWTNDQDTSWTTFNAGNTNWADLAGTDVGSTPGPLDTVIFSSQVSTAALPVGPAIPTTLDGTITINHLAFNGQTSGTGAAAVVIAPGTAGSLTISPAIPTDGISVPNASGTASISAPVELGADQTWSTGTATGNLGSVLSVSGVMSGSGNLTKAGLGTATITGNNTRTGKTIIDGGVLNINAEAALGANPSSATPDQLTFNGGTLRFSAATLIDDANRGITINAAGLFNTAAAGGTIASSVVITGGGQLFKIGANMLVLNAANTHSGGSRVLGGILQAGNNTAFGTGPASLEVANSVLELTNGVIAANPITLLGTTAGSSGAKTLRLVTGATSGEFSGAITVTETGVGNFRVSAAAGGTLTLSGAITTTAPNNTGIRKEGAGTVILSNAANALRGPSSIAAGVLQHGANNVLASTTAVTVHGTGGGAATLDLNGFNQSIGTLTYNGGGGGAGSVNTVQTGGGTLTLGGNVTVNSNGNPTAPATLSGNVVIAATRTFTVNDSTGSVTDMLLSATVTGAGGITKAGLGTMVLSSANTYGGTTTVNLGTLRNGISNAIPIGNALVVNATLGSAAANYDTAGFNQSVASLTYGGSTLANTTNNVTTGAGTLTLNGNVTTNSVGAGGPMQATLGGTVFLGSVSTTFTVANTTNAQADLQVSAALFGPGNGLVKDGPGTMEVSATNTYSGPTVINAGVLRVTGSISASSVTVNAGGTLGGTGTTGAVTVNSGGTIDPGASIGTLNTGALTLNGTSTFQLEIDTTFVTSDKLIAAGNLSLNALNTVVLSITDLGLNATLTLGTKFTFIEYSGVWDGGLFSFGGNPVPDDTQLTFGPNIYTLDYNDVAGTAVSLTVVPEPGVAASVLGGLGLLLGLQRRPRRRPAAR